MLVVLYKFLTVILNNKTTETILCVGLSPDIINIGILYIGT